MSTEVTAKDGDCLCVIAMQNGFFNCQPLRDEPKNAAFLKRPLQSGDVVTVPDFTKKDLGKPTDNAHAFVKLNSPPVSIRYVRGTADGAYKDDPDTVVLNVSNFPTTKGGKNAETDFPTDFGFHPEGDADPDAFKIEVVDPAAGGTVTAILEPLMPKYNLINGKSELTGHDFLPTHSQTFIQCQQVPSTVAFRSKYLRIVTHQEDNAAALEQTLLVASLADGKGKGLANDPDNVEILDFQIQASYLIPRCTAPTKCKVSVSKPLGDDSEKRRFRIAYHVFIKRDTGAPIGGLTAEKVRHCALRDLREFYAQASMAPKLVSADGSDNGLPVIFVPEPDNNMIAIGETTGQGASTHGNQDTKSFLTVTDASAGVIATVNFGEKMHPSKVAEAIQNAVDGAKFKVEIFKNPKPNKWAKHSSYDVLITRLDGARVDLSVQTDDSILQNNITVVRVDLDAIDLSSQVGPRRLFRASPGPAGAINVYSIGKTLDTAEDAALFRHNLAFSMPVSYKINIEGTQARLLADSIFCEAQWMDETTKFPDILPHECGHILGQCAHVATNDKDRGIKADPHLDDEMMNPNSKEPSEDGPNATRISDFPILVNYELHDDKFRLINAVNRFTTTRPDLLENW